MGRKAAQGSQGDRQSAMVQQFLAEAGAAPPPPPPQQVVGSAGFVPRTAESEAAKEQAKTFNRDQLLKVDDDDTQVKIYNAYAENANTSAEGVNNRRGLGSSSGASAGPPRRGFMSFVSAGGAPAATPAATGTAATPAAATPATTPAAGHPLASSASAPLPPGWSMGSDPASGYPYYANLATGQTQWHPPPPEPPPPPPPPAALPAGWVAATDPASGHTYYSNPSTGQSSWTPPLPPPTFVAPPPRAAAAATPPAAPAGATVKVRGLPASMSDTDVREMFSASGRVTHVALERDAYSSGQQPKSATISFDAPASAQVAIKTMDGTKMRAITLHVELVGGDGGKPAYRPY